MYYSFKPDDQSGKPVCTNQFKFHRVLLRDSQKVDLCQHWKLLNMGRQVERNS